ncbi:PAK4-inhibitor INKA2 [Gastrophryne carolinensis]
MDQYIRRLRQELLSMREFGDGLQEQMNSMMGALQELKLLQVQTALEQLEISREETQFQNMKASPYTQNAREAFEVRHQSNKHAANSSAAGQSLDKSSLANSRGSWAASSQSSVSVPGPKLGHQVISEKGRASEIRHRSSVLPTVTNRSTNQVPCAVLHNRRNKDIASYHFEQEHCTDGAVLDDTNDWTSSLMSQCRNRQPLILGDNIFADLVGNWLDLPEMEKKAEKDKNQLNSHKSQDIYKKFSLSANFFKKFLRSVRPDRDKLLKEKPGWQHSEDQTSPISKRSKKTNKQKGVFYFPSQADNKNKTEKTGKATGKSLEKLKTLAKKDHGQENGMYTGFDMNTAVWV